MNFKTIILFLVAVIGMVSPAFAKTKAIKNTDNDVSSDTEQVEEHDINVDRKSVVRERVFTGV